MARKRAVDPDLTVTYVRVSTEEQARSGLGLDAQRTKVGAEIVHRGWTHVREYADEGVSAKTTAGRPGLTAAIAAMDAGEAKNLVVMKLDRLARSSHDFTGLTAHAERKGWNLVVLDIGLDMSTPNGKFLASIMAAVAELERDMIAERTSVALQAKRGKGARLGRPGGTPPTIVERIATRRANGETFTRIANDLNRGGVPTTQGGARWYPATVRAVLARRTPVCWTWDLPEVPVQDWDGLVAWQAGRCALCGCVGLELVRDHDHATGKRRGMLCRSCNVHEGTCGDRECSCLSYRARSPAAMLGVDVEHGGDVEVPETADEEAVRIARVRDRVPSP